MNRAPREPEGAPDGSHGRPDVSGSDEQQGDHGERQERRQPETSVSGRCRPSCMNAASTGPTANPQRAGRAEEADDRADPCPRRHVSQRGQHHARVSQLEPHEQEARRELPRLPGEGDPGEDDRLHEALRTITARRLYLSAQTPQNGTRKMPNTKIRLLNRPGEDRYL